MTETTEQAPKASAGEEPALQLWLVNQYAISTDQPGIARHYVLADLMRKHNVDTTIIASDVHYLTRQANTQDGPLIRVDQQRGARFVWLRTPPYATNGLGRIVNMITFARRAAGVKVKNTGTARPDVVLGSSPNLFAAVAAWRLARRYRVPFALEVRDIHPKSIMALMGVSPRHPYVMMQAHLEKFLYKHADLILSPLQGLPSHIMQTIGRAPKVLWIPNGIDPKSVPQTPLKDENSSFVVMYAGAHGVANSLETAIDAFVILSQRDPKYKLVLIGAGVEKTALQERAKDRELANIEFRDPVPKAEIHQTLRQADAFLFLLRDTPLWEDGLSPNKLYDYLGGGRPTILAVDTPYDPVTEAGAGITVRPEDPQALADGIEYLANTPKATRQQMADNGRRYVEKHHDLSQIAATLASEIHHLGVFRVR